MTTEHSSKDENDKRVAAFAAIVELEVDGINGVINDRQFSDRASLIIVEYGETLRIALRRPHEPRAQRLELCLQKVMARLADLLDSDHFNNIEAMVLEAGVGYPPLGTNPLDISFETSGEHCSNCGAVGIFDSEHNCYQCSNCVNAWKPKNTEGAGK